MSHYQVTQGHRRTFPAWLDTRDAEARRGSLAVRSVDPELIVGLNRKTHTYEVWGPSLALRGWVPLCECTYDDGRPMQATSGLPWGLVVRALREAREATETSVERVARHNEALEERARREHSAQTADALAFVKGGIGEHRTRVDADDMTRAYKRQTFGEKAAPVGRKIYVPGGRH